MNEISPQDAAQLASDIYKLRTSNQIQLFLTHPVFKSTTGKPNHNHLIAELGGRVLLNTEDGFGICSAGGDRYKNDLFLVFRGTIKSSNADILTDARIGIKNNSSGLPVHIGFDHCFRSMENEISKFIDSYRKQVMTVHCIGHSLGGAVASLAADWVVNKTNHNVKLYTFGSPRVGTEWFVKSTSTAIGHENIHRVFHRTDPVPMVPLYPFMHAPYNNNGHYVFSADPLTSGAAHEVRRYIQSAKQYKSWKSMNLVPEQPYNVEVAIENWLKSKSPVNTSSSTFWRWVESAIIYVLKKITMGAIYMLQSVFIAGFTIADKIAYILAKGIDLAENISIWVQLLMRKLMQALGMVVAKSKEQLTRSLIRYVLIRISDKATRDAQNAIRNV